MSNQSARHSTIGARTVREGRWEAMLQVVLPVFNLEGLPTCSNRMVSQVRIVRVG